jgi:hypothetical protein
MIVIKFSLTGGFVELYFKTRGSADAAFEAFRETQHAAHLSTKKGAHSLFAWTDDFSRVAALPLAAVNGAQLFDLENEIAAQINIAQVRNDATLREQQRVQTRASGLIVPAGAPLPR